MYGVDHLQLDTSEPCKRLYGRLWSSSDNTWSWWSRTRYGECTMHSTLNTYYVLFI